MTGELVAKDPTLDFLATFSDESKWIKVENAPVFVPHKRTVPGKDGKPVEIEVGVEDLQYIAEQINEREHVYGVPAVLTLGHRVQNDPHFKEKDQPDIVGYGRHATVGTFGQMQLPAVLVTLYYKRSDWDEAKKYPFRSVDFYPNSKKVTGIALLKRDPFLPMGVVSYGALGNIGKAALKAGKTAVSGTALKDAAIKGGLGALGGAASNAAVTGIMGGDKEQIKQAAKTGAVFGGTSGAIGTLGAHASRGFQKARAAQAWQKSRAGQPQAAPAAGAPQQAAAQPAAQPTAKGAPATPPPLPKTPSHIDFAHANASHFEAMAKKGYDVRGLASKMLSDVQKAMLDQQHTPEDLVRLQEVARRLSMLKSPPKTAPAPAAPVTNASVGNLRQYSSSPNDTTKLDTRTHKGTTSSTSTKPKFDANGKPILPPRTPQPRTGVIPCDNGAPKNLGGRIAGAAAGTAAGAGLGMLGGPAAPVTVPAGAAVGGIVGEELGGKHLKFDNAGGDSRTKAPKGGITLGDHTFPEGTYIPKCFQKFMKKDGDSTSYTTFHGPLGYEAKHAPVGGVTIGGKHFVGGQFITAADMAKATPEEKAALEGGDKTEAPKYGPQVKEPRRASNAFGLLGRKNLEGPVQRHSGVMQQELKSNIANFIADAPPEVQKELQEHLNTTLTGHVGDFISKAKPEELHALSQELTMRQPGATGSANKAPKGGITIDGHHFGEGQYIPPSMLKRAPPDIQKAVNGPGWGDVASRGSRTFSRMALPGPVGWWLRRKARQIVGDKRFPAKEAAVVAGLIAATVGGYMGRNYLKHKLGISMKMPLGRAGVLAGKIPGAEELGLRPQVEPHGPLTDPNTAVPAGRPMPPRENVPLVHPLREHRGFTFPRGGVPLEALPAGGPQHGPLGGNAAAQPPVARHAPPPTAALDTGAGHPIPQPMGGGAGMAAAGPGPAFATTGGSPGASRQLGARFPRPPQLGSGGTVGNLGFANSFADDATPETYQFGPLGSAPTVKHGQRQVSTAGR